MTKQTSENDYIYTEEQSDAAALYTVEEVTQEEYTT